MIKDLKPLTTIFAKIGWRLKLGFNISQLLMHRKESDYGTATGWPVSIVVFIVFVTLFWNFVQTANMELINSSMNIVSESYRAEGRYMFGLAINCLNLTMQKSPTSTSLTQRFFGPFYSIINVTQVELQGSLHLHQEIEEFFKRFSISNVFCLPIDSLAFRTVEGKNLTSSVLLFYWFLTATQQSILDSQGVAQIEAIQSQLGYFTISLPVINTLTNAGDTDYAFFL